MNINSISYGRTKNLGNYESERLDMTAEVGAGEDPVTVVLNLQDMVRALLYPPAAASPKPPVPPPSARPARPDPARPMPPTPRPSDSEDLPF